MYSNYLAYLTWFSSESIDQDKIEKLISMFNNSEPQEENYVSKNFGGTYFSEYNAMKIGYIREQIEMLSEEINYREKAILITSLLYAMDKVANTVGHYDAYRRKLDSLREIKLLVPDVNDKLNRENRVFNMDANELVREISAG